MKEALIRLVSSMKFWTALLGLLGIVAAKYGFDVDQELYWSIVGVVGLLLAGQAATDHGKAAAQVHANSMASEWVPTGEDEDEETEQA